MISTLKKIFGTKHQRDIKKLMPLVEKINQLDEEYNLLSEESLKAKTDEFRKRITDGELIDDMVCEAFAVVKNACRRMKGRAVNVCGHDLVWDMVPFDVQLIGGLVLHFGNIAEMATGEGKTLVATLPLYLNGLTGKNVHLVTVNDYLAKRDSQWMGALFEYLGLTVGCIQNAMASDERREQYAKDITYGTNSEFGFDYLRDNGMAYQPESLVQRGYYYAIIDEVDSILIDEARTPLIISGPAPVSTHRFSELKPRVERLVRKQRELCNDLVQKARKLLGEGNEQEAQLLLYQIHHGMPKHRQMMHMLEDPDIRKLHEQIEGQMLTDMRKEQARFLREELLFNIDERGHDASLTDKGCSLLNPSDPDMFVMPDLVTAMADLDADTSLSEEQKAKKKLTVQENFMERSEMIHNVDQLIRAYCLYEKDVEYVVQENKVIIVDENTGRLMPGRRWSEGLHQAVEAKEGVKIERETQTLATITIQNYFRMYDKLAGMTGTAETEAGEFHSIYKLDVVVIPTNRPVRRVDGNDVIYKTQREKFNAVVAEIEDCHQRGQPVLVGTVTVDTSEILSRMLKRKKITHNVLNAKNHEREAEIVTRAGQRGAVTIATNMAGRGTDIKLGEGVITIDRKVIQSSISLEDNVEGKTLRQILEEKPSGLHVIGSERHESRRIDRQLRGRCARQGDPGSSRFYISLEDNLMRLFGSDRIANVMSRLGLEEGQQLEARLLNRSIESAQRKVEQHNFNIRKRTLEYDDVMNQQREVIYGFRGEIVRMETVREAIYDILSDQIEDQVTNTLLDDSDRCVNLLVEWVIETFPVSVKASEIKARTEDPEKVAQYIFDAVRRSYDLKISMEQADSVDMMERHVVLSSIDNHWQDYLRSMDALRQGVGLRAYGQRDPLIEYKKEAFQMFEELMSNIKQEICTTVFRASTSLASMESFMESLPQTLVHDEVNTLGSGGGVSINDAMQGHDPFADAVMGDAPPTGPAPIRRDAAKVGRNDPCPCGSGKKYKKCCGS